MLISLALSLFLTLLLEGLFALIWGLRGWREWAVLALVNLLTNPTVVLLYHLSTGLWGMNAVLVTLVLECSAVVVEWRCYKSCSYQLKRPFLFALFANAFSYGVGFIIQLI